MIPIITLTSFSAGWLLYGLTHKRPRYSVWLAYSMACFNSPHVCTNNDSHGSLKGIRGWRARS